jgi:hypothetical protein
MMEKTSKLLLLLTIAATIFSVAQTTTHSHSNQITDMEINAKVTGPVHYHGNPLSNLEVKSYAPEKVHPQHVHPKAHNHKAYLINEGFKSKVSKKIEQMVNQDHDLAPKAPKMLSSRVNTYHNHNNYERPRHEQQSHQSAPEPKLSNNDQTPQHPPVTKPHSEAKDYRESQPQRQAVKHQMSHEKLTNQKFVENLDNCHEVETVCVRKCKIQHFAKRTYQKNPKKFTYKIFAHKKKMTTGNFAQFRSNSKRNIMCQKKCYEKNR